jgi:hypothetical protein
MKCEACDIRLTGADGGGRMCQSCHRDQWLNGAEMPDCIDCGTPTVCENLLGEPLCMKCFDKREEATWIKQQAERVGR